MRLLLDGHWLMPHSLESVESCVRLLGLSQSRRNGRFPSSDAIQNCQQQKMGGAEFKGLFGDLLEGSRVETHDSGDQLADLVGTYAKDFAQNGKLLDEARERRPASGWIQRRRRRIITRR